MSEKKQHRLTDGYAVYDAVEWTGNNLVEIKELLRASMARGVESSASGCLWVTDGIRGYELVPGDTVLYARDHGLAVCRRGQMGARYVPLGPADEGGSTDLENGKGEYPRYTDGICVYKVMQWNGGNNKEVSFFIIGAQATLALSGRGTWGVYTPRIDYDLRPGDYILRDDDANVAVVQHEDFRAMFHRVDDPAEPDNARHTPDTSEASGDEWCACRESCACGAHDAKSAGVHNGLYCDTSGVPNGTIRTGVSREEYDSTKKLHDSAMREALRNLVNMEAALATARYGGYHSPHEGLAVIEEELYEVSSAEDDVTCGIDSLRMRVFHNDDIAKHRSTAEGIHEYAVALAQEAIHVAATAKRYMQSVDAADGEFTRG